MRCVVLTRRRRCCYSTLLSASANTALRLLLVPASTYADFASITLVQSPVMRVLSGLSLRNLAQFALILPCFASGLLLFLQSMASLMTATHCFLVTMHGTMLVMR